MHGPEHMACPASTTTQDGPCESVLDIPSQARPHSGRTDKALAEEDSLYHRELYHHLNDADLREDTSELAEQRRPARPPDFSRSPECSFRAERWESRQPPVVPDDVSLHKTIAKQLDTLNGHFETVAAAQRDLRSALKLLSFRALPTHSNVDSTTRDPSKSTLGTLHEGGFQRVGSKATLTPCLARAASKATYASQVLRS
eukprot:TRINITY_DN824_c1_g1_i1.p1 TRINITY_DN824_c1_g1~~TRINITY_DN824_c1_g1_i1.p1  ORF type:complete len:200 (+),score=15.49 TRINITY_DN824_c1_g1_i1:157-756(+)